jgi:hypothetical protein
VKLSRIKRFIIPSQKWLNPPETAGPPTARGG